MRTGLLCPGAAGFAELRVAVVSPFVDRRHGTERCIAEQLERFAARPGAEIHLYSQRVEDLGGVARYPSDASPGRILWHKVSAIPGPHLLTYIWWFLANHMQRLWDFWVRGLKFDLLYSPGINALDADVISVHIVFHEFYLQIRPRLKFRKAQFASWPRLFHRRLYYRLIMGLERRIYRRRENSLAAISGLVARELATHFQRTDGSVIRYGVDSAYFSPSLRLARRNAVRGQLRLSPRDFILLLIGNDWENKGLEALLDALAACRELPLRLLVIGRDDRKRYETTIRDSGLVDRVLFLDPSPDVLQFYAAADAYVGPSLEDAYGLPFVEAMACGLPVVASSRAGASEIIDDRSNGMILREPEDSHELAGLLRALFADPDLCRQIGQEAWLTAQQQTWDRNAEAVWQLLEDAAARKHSNQALHGKP